MYIFNTFFYERLTTTAKGRRGINYEAVEKWTSKIDIFQYDFVVVPINERYAPVVACVGPFIDEAVVLIGMWRSSVTCPRWWET